MCNYITFLYKYENIENYTKKTILAVGCTIPNQRVYIMDILKEESIKYGLPLLVTQYGYKIEDESTDTIVYYLERLEDEIPYIKINQKREYN